jgi:hypothetical protein
LGQTKTFPRFSECQFSPSYLTFLEMNLAFGLRRKNQLQCITKLLRSSCTAEASTLAREMLLAAEHPQPAS